MKPFALVRLPTLLQASQHCKSAPNTTMLRAGGVDVLDHLKEHLAEPEQLIDLHAIAGASGQAMRSMTANPDGSWRLGALVTLAKVAAMAELDDWPSAYAALSEAAASAATPNIRNQATVGGNLLQRPRCWYYRNADLQCLKKGGHECFAVSGDNRYNAIFGGGPSFIVHPSTLAVALTALAAAVVVIGPYDTRTFPIAELFALPAVDPAREHTLAAGEIVIQLALPPAEVGARSAYIAAKEKRSHDWPLAEAAVSLRVESGRMHDVRVVLGHVAPIPWRSTAAEAVLEGQVASESLFDTAAQAALRDARALSHNAYKVPLARGVLRHALHHVTQTPLPD